MPTLSVAILTLNEAQSLPGCIRSVSALADEVLVVDSGSTDQTREIAASMGARVVFHEWEGFANQRNFALNQATGDWCLMLDADERVSEGLKSAIAAAIAGDRHAGFSIPFRTMMFGRVLHHGAARFERHPRLFRKGHAQWVQKGARDVVNVKGSTGALRSHIIHEPYQTVTDFLESMNSKTSLEAYDRWQNGVKFSWKGILTRPLFFAYQYFLLLGFLDGWPGFLHAYLSAMGRFIGTAKLFDLERMASEAPRPTERNSMIPRCLTPSTTTGSLSLKELSDAVPAATPTVEMPMASPPVAGSDAAADTADSAEITQEIYAAKVEEEEEEKAATESGATLPEIPAFTPGAIAVPPPADDK